MLATANYRLTVNQVVLNNKKKNSQQNYILAFLISLTDFSHLNYFTYFTINVFISDATQTTNGELLAIF